VSAPQCGILPLNIFIKIVGERNALVAG
jgi:hypothetical protein